MRIKKHIVNWPQNFIHARPVKQWFKKIEQATNQLTIIWRKLEDRSYSWDLSGLKQLQSLLQSSAKHSKKVQIQLKKLSQEVNSQLIPIFKSQTFLNALAHKMKLSHRTISTIPALLNKFAQTETPFSSTSLLILVLFVAFGTQVPLIIKGSFNAKKALFTVTTVLDYVTTAIQLAKHFQKNKAQ